VLGSVVFQNHKGVTQNNDFNDDRLAVFNDWMIKCSQLFL